MTKPTSGKKVLAKILEMLAKGRKLSVELTFPLVVISTRDEVITQSLSCSVFHILKNPEDTILGALKVLDEEYDKNVDLAVGEQSTKVFDPSGECLHTQVDKVEESSCQDQGQADWFALHIRGKGSSSQN